MFFCYVLGLWMLIRYATYQKNVLLDGQFHPRLVDFGLAVIEDENGLNPTTENDAYSRNWTAPERIDPESPDDGRTEEADIYAFGCLCYAVSSGLSQLVISPELISLLMAGMPRIPTISSRAQEDRESYHDSQRCPT
jgi:hypothetical protein